MLQRLRAASRGDLTHGSELKAVERAPDLWEIRRGWDGISGESGYQAEPSMAPRTIVGLRLHAKDLDGGEAEIRAKQNSEIEVARHRYNSGRAGAGAWSEFVRANPRCCIDWAL